MQQTVEIKAANAAKAYQQGSDTDRTLLQNLIGPETMATILKHNLPVMERVKTWADVLAENSMTAEEFEKGTQGLLPDEIGYRKVKMICKALNEGWTPNWDDANETKYYPWFRMDSARGFSSHVYVLVRQRSFVGSRLCFKSSELAKYAGTQFRTEYEQFLK